MRCDFSVLAWGKNKLRRTKWAIQYLGLAVRSADVFISPFIGFVIKNHFVYLYKNILVSVVHQWMLQELKQIIGLSLMHWVYLLGHVAPLTHNHMYTSSPTIAQINLIWGSCNHAWKKQVGKLAEPEQQTNGASKYLAPADPSRV